jgi:hypothetical protein
MKRAFFIAGEHVHLSLPLSAFICGKRIFSGSSLMGTDTAAASLA